MPILVLPGVRAPQLVLTCQWLKERITMSAAETADQCAYLVCGGGR